MVCGDAFLLSTQLTPNVRSSVLQEYELALHTLIPSTCHHSGVSYLAPKCPHTSYRSKFWVSLFFHTLIPLLGMSKWLSYSHTQYRLNYRQKIYLSNFKLKLFDGIWSSNSAILLLFFPKKSYILLLLNLSYFNYVKSNMSE